MSNIQERQNEIVQQFSQYSQWEDRYKKLIEMAKGAPDLPDELKTEEAKVKGCQSQVWLHAELNQAGKVVFKGDSDALLVKGLLCMVLYVYSNASPAEILSSNSEFIKLIGFEAHLTPSRANGLNSMLKQVKNFAIAFAALQASQKN